MTLLKINYLFPANYAYTNQTLPRSIVSQFPAGSNLYITEVRDGGYKQIFVNSAEIQLSLTKHTKVVVHGEEVSQVRMETLIFSKYASSLAGFVNADIHSVFFALFEIDNAVNMHLIHVTTKPYHLLQNMCLSIYLYIYTSNTGLENDFDWLLRTFS